MISTILVSAFLAVLVIAALLYLWLVRYVMGRWKFEIGKDNLAPYFEVPTHFPWSLWSKGRSATLLLPWLGIVVFVAFEDRMGSLSERWRWNILMGHERGVRAEQFREHGYRFYPRYIFSRDWRFSFEGPAFRESVRIAEAEGIKYALHGRDDLVSPAFHFATVLSEQYRLGKDYSFVFCYDYLDGYLDGFEDGSE